MEWSELYSILCEDCFGWADGLACAGSCIRDEYTNSMIAEYEEAIWEMGYMDGQVEMANRVKKYKIGEVL